MKRMLIFLMFLSLLVPAALAETALVPDYYAPMNPSLTKFAAEAGREVPGMRLSAYLSANEIWYAYGTPYGTNTVVLERHDKWGALRDIVTLKDLPGTDHEVMCVTRVGDLLLVGMRNLALRGTVVVLDEANRELVQVTLPGGVGIMSMQAAPEGILCSGFMGKGTQSCFYLALVDAEGHIVFENTDIARDADFNMGALAESVSCAGERGYYATICERTRGEIHFRDRILVGFDAAGAQRWENRLPDTIEIDGMTAAGGVVYLYGSYGEQDEYGAREVRQGWAGAWSEDGECLWQRIFETPEKFGSAVADETGCFLIGGFFPVRMAAVYATGDMREMYRLQFPDNVCIIGLATDAGALTMTGYLYGEEKLFYFEMR